MQEELNLEYRTDLIDVQYGDDVSRHINHHLPISLCPCLGGGGYEGLVGLARVYNLAVKLVREIVTARVTVAPGVLRLSEVLPPASSPVTDVHTEPTIAGELIVVAVSQSQDRAPLLSKAVLVIVDRPELGSCHTLSLPVTINGSLPTHKQRLQVGPRVSEGVRIVDNFHLPNPVVRIVVDEGVGPSFIGHVALLVIEHIKDNIKLTTGAETLIYPHISIVIATC